MNSAAGCLNIWHLVESYPPHYGGGAAITTRDVCQGLALRGHHVRVLCTEITAADPYTIRSEMVGPVRVDRVNLPYFRSTDPEGWALGFSHWRRHERQIRRLLELLLADWRPDLVDYHTTRPFGEEALFTLARLRLPVVATLHDAWLICLRVFLLQSPSARPCPGPSPLRCLECMYSHYDGGRTSAILKLPRRIARLGCYPAYRLRRRLRACRTLAGALARSEFMADMHSLHIAGPTRHIPLGIDQTGLPRHRPVRPRSPVRFGFLAGFQPAKGIGHLLDATASLIRHGLACEVHIWGPGQERAQELLAARGLDGRVFLRGMYLPEDCWSVYEQLDVAVMATVVSEPLGRVPQEAALAGVPTIAPAVGGLGETIRHDVDGLLYRFKDPADLERQMRRVIEEPALLPRLISQLRSVPDTRDQIAEVEAWYHEVLARVRKSAAVPLPVIS